MRTWSMKIRLSGMKNRSKRTNPKTKNSKEFHKFKTKKNNRKISTFSTNGKGYYNLLKKANTKKPSKCFFSWMTTYTF